MSNTSPKFKNVTYHASLAILSSQNSFRFCAGLADNVLAAEPKSHNGAHLAVFRPAKKIEKSLSEYVALLQGMCQPIGFRARLSIPLSWFRSGAPRAFSIVYCLRRTLTISRLSKSSSLEQSTVRIVKEAVSARSCSQHTRSYYNECSLVS